MVRVDSASSAMPSRSQNPPNGVTFNEAFVTAALSQAVSAAPTQASKATTSRTPSQAGSNAGINTLVNGLNGDGDQFTVSMQAGARIGFPLEEIDIPGIGGPLAQYGYDVNVTQVGGGPNAQYQVTFNKDLMAGVNVEADTRGGETNGQLQGATLGVESNLISSGTVTMTFVETGPVTRPRRAAPGSTGADLA